MAPFTHSSDSFTLSCGRVDVCSQVVAGSHVQFILKTDLKDFEQSPAAPETAVAAVRLTVSKPKETQHVPGVHLPQSEVSQDNTL